jgi:hypothetical protein
MTVPVEGDDRGIARVRIASLQCRRTGLRTPWATWVQVPSLRLLAPSHAGAHGRRTARALRNATSAARPFAVILPLAGSAAASLQLRTLRGSRPLTRRQGYARTAHLRPRSEYGRHVRCSFYPIRPRPAQCVTTFVMQGLICSRGQTTRVTDDKDWPLRHALVARACPDARRWRPSDHRRSAG